MEFKQATYGKDKRDLYKPFVRIDHSKCKHKSCWNCEFVRVGRQFFRICAVDPRKHIWGGDPDNEFRETGISQADICPSFRFDTETGKVTLEDSLVVEYERKRIGIKF
jgi:hypothetical protein